MHDEIMLLFYYLTALWQTAFHCHLQSLQTSEKGHGIYGASSLLAACVSLSRVKGQPYDLSTSKKSQCWHTSTDQNSFLHLTYIFYHPLQMWGTSNMRFTMWAQSARALAAWLAGFGLLAHRKRGAPALHYCQNTCWVLAPHPKWISTKWHTSHSLPGKQTPVPSITQRAKVSILCWLLWLCSQRGSSEE